MSSNYQLHNDKDDQIVTVSYNSELNTNIVRPINTIDSTQLQSERINEQLNNEVIEKLVDDINQKSKLENNQQYFSLFKNKNISIFTRYFMLIIIMINVYLFISAGTTIGGSIGVYFSIFSLQSKTVKLKQFSMADTIHDMWQAGLYPLVFLLTAFSGAWPYIKLIFMFLCWTLNEKKLKPQTREKILVILDTMGKWSFIDTYVVAIMIVGFRFDLSYIIIKNYQISLEIVVGIAWGYYCLVLGTSVSLITTHFMIYYHRKSIERNDIQINNEILISQQQYQLEQQQQEQTIENLSEKTIFTYYLVISVLFISLTLLIYGATVYSYSFEFLGLAGFLLKQKGTNQVKESMLEMGLEIVSKSSEPGSFGIRSIQILYYTMGFAVPILFLIVLFILWTVPMKLNKQKNLFFIAEILNAWSCIDVYIVSIIFSIIQMKQFAQWLIGDKCDVLNQYLKIMDQDFHIIDLDGNDSCFIAQTSLLYGSLILFSSALLYVISGTIILRKCQTNLNKLINLKTKQ